MPDASLWTRLGLWRVTRSRPVRRCYDRLEEVGLSLAQLDQFEREATASVPEATDPPADVSLTIVAAADGVPEHLRGEPIAPADRVVRAERDGAVVGCCCLSDRPVYVPELRRRLTVDGAYLWRLYVDPAERGRGIGSAIVGRAVEAAADGDAARIQALVAPDNVPSRRAFRSLGFAPTARHASLGLGDRGWYRRRQLASDGSPD